MRPEIEAYLRQHGSRYTTEALRRTLLDAGHDPVEVDNALREWQAEQSGTAASAEDRRTFRRWALWLHVGALVAMIGLAIFLNGTEALGLALISVVVLGLFLALGWAISFLIGRALLPRTGVWVALIFPVISAVGLGGACLAIIDGMIPTPPTPGVVELQIDEPLGFTGSGTGSCFIQTEAGAVAREAAFSVSADNLGTLDGRTVSVYVDSYQAQNADATANVSISLVPSSEAEPHVAYGTRFDTRVEQEASADLRSGSVTFEGLFPEPVEPGSADDLDPISGTVTWTCE